MQPTTRQNTTRIIDLSSAAAVLRIVRVADKARAAKLRRERLRRSWLGRVLCYKLTGNAALYEELTRAALADGTEVAG